MSDRLEMEDEEEEIEVAKVPAKVRQAAAKAVKGAKWEAAFRLKIKEGELFELEGVDAKGRGVVVTVSPDGVVDEIETEIRPKDLPDAVAKAVREKVPAFKAHVATEISENGKVTGYEIEGRRAKEKRDILITVSPDGKTVETDEGFAIEKGRKGDKKGKSEPPKDKKGKK
jgi:hypothetical protein